MSLYKQLIYGVTLILIGTAGYYFHAAGVPGLVAQGSKDNRGSGVGAAEVFSGTYMCDENSGCNVPIKLVLEDDTTLDIISTVEGIDSSLGQGTWGVGTGGAIIMMIRNPGGQDENYPSSLIAAKVSSLRITGFSKKKPLLPGMKDPVFKRVDDRPKKTVPQGTTTTDDHTSFE